MKAGKSRFTTGTIFCSEPERQPKKPLMSCTCTDLRAVGKILYIFLGYFLRRIRGRRKSERMLHNRHMFFLGELH